MVRKNTQKNWIVGIVFIKVKKRGFGERAKKNHATCVILEVAPIGLEPIQTEPESAVLPLHHRAKV